MLEQLNALCGRRVTLTTAAGCHVEGTLEEQDGEFVINPDGEEGTTNYELHLGVLYQFDGPNITIVVPA